MIKRFNRFELKYIIPVSIAHRLQEDLRGFAQPDPYSGEEGYPLVSLYYDSTDLDFFWNKIEGIKYRRKVRLRIYPKTPITDTTHGMVEIKQRISRTVQKRRLKLSIEEGHRLCTEGVMPEGPLEPADDQVASEVQFIHQTMQLVPTCITAYHRAAYMGGTYEPGLRITFDTNVRYRTHALTVNADAHNYLIIPGDWCILEVKANDRVPDWVTSLIARHNCELHRVSKYCAGVARSQKLNVMALAMSPVKGMEGI